MKIFNDSLHKIVYATDASAYREIPQACHVLDGTGIKAVHPIEVLEKMLK